MPAVDNKIHFVWVGNPIPEDKVDLIMKHLFMNCPDYQVFLWTDKPYQNSQVFSSVVNRGDARHADIASRSWWESGYYRTALTFSGNTTLRAGNQDFQARIIGPERRLTFIDISCIDAECGSLTARYQSAIKTHDYGRASDILRLGIISKEGGIYMDTDVTCLKKLPVDIPAPEGLLIGHGQADLANALTNAVVAAPQGSRTVAEFMNAIRGQFRKYDRKRWWDVVERNRKDRAKSLTRAEAANAHDDIRGAKINYQNAMMAGTNVVTGPEVAVMFLYYYLLRPDPLKLDPDRLLIALKADNAKSPGEYLHYVRLAQRHIFKPALEASGMISRIGFPKGYLDIGSEASWIQNARV